MKIMTQLTVAAAALGACAPASATVIDFADQSAGIHFGHIATNGVTFQSGSDEIFVRASGEFGINDICAFENGQCSAAMYATFSEPVHDVSFKIFGVDAQSWLYAAGDYSFGAGPVMHFETLRLASTGLLVDLSQFGTIHSLALGSNDPAGIGYNYFTFTPGAAAGAVPEPSAWALMIVGFGLVGAARRRSGAIRAIVAS